ncbi:MAG: hypothetical protein GX130_14515 [Candidatus Hydrogenedens sp.]|jgi:hypothetical protein|nr:hypothetical protein [Candidatus Hydrogenedens sp.]
MTTQKKKITRGALLKLAEKCGSRIAHDATEVLDRDKICTLLEHAWKKAGICFEMGVWFPEFLDGMKLNCGLYVDFLLEKRLAVMIAGSDKPRATVEEELAFCADSSLFDDAVILHFGKRFHCIPVAFNDITCSWIKVTPPAAGRPS